MFDSLKKLLRYLLRLFGVTLVIILFFEVFLRVVFGFPRGLFNFAVPGKNGLYPESSTIEMVWGPIPYTIQTNSLGFRGKEISVEKPEGKIRIVGLGDSITDGFFVDNDATYPALLENILTQKGYFVEVINAARGGASIDKEYAILRELVLSLHPDVVLLTFVTNDIVAIQGKSQEELLSETIHDSHESVGISLWLLTKTATLETLADLYLRIQSKSYRAAKASLGEEDRYNIEGGDQYLENARRFHIMSRDADGIILNEPFPEEVMILIKNYLFMLAKLNSLCQENDITLIFIYFPSYSQVYNPSISLKIRDIFRTVCNHAPIPFLDLTETFRQEGKETILHLAPVDYHLNPTGYTVMAEAIAQFLLDGDFLKQPKVKSNN